MRYTKAKTKEYLPSKYGESDCCECGFMKDPNSPSCKYCSSEIYQAVVRTAVKGTVDPLISKVLGSLSCK